MSFRALKYLPMYIGPGVVLFSLYMQNIWSFFAVIFVFVLIPIVEIFTTGTKENMNKVEEELAKKDPLYDYLIWTLVPIQYCFLVYFLHIMSSNEYSLITTIGLISSFGISCGVLGINAAHELGHRNTKHEKFMSKALLLTSMYLHFFIEHNRGHHMNVSTHEDPASSRFGENIYSFYVRSVVGSYLSAWEIENRRLRKSGKKVFSLQNEMVRFQIIQFVFLLAIFLVFGLKATLCFLVSAVLGFLLLETVNYIEHYGLQRKKNEKRYERTMPHHSWNSNHPVGRMLLLELSRHSDHHFEPTRKYQILRNFEESPQMPTGYPGMMLLAFFPPLWFKVMNPLVEKYAK